MSKRSDGGYLWAGLAETPEELSGKGPGRPLAGRRPWQVHLYYTMLRFNGICEWLSASHSGLIRSNAFSSSVNSREKGIRK